MDNVGSFKVDHRVLDLLICLDTADPAALFVLSVLKGRSDWSELRCFHTQEQEVTGQERGHKRTFWFVVNLCQKLNAYWKCSGEEDNFYFVYLFQ